MNDPFCWGFFAWSLQQLLIGLSEDVGLKGQEANLPSPTTYRDGPFRTEIWSSLESIPDLWRGHAHEKPREQQSLTCTIAQSEHLSSTQLEQAPLWVSGTFSQPNLYMPPLTSGSPWPALLSTLGTVPTGLGPVTGP